MPLPFILGVGAAVAGIAGIGNGISGGIKMKEAKDTLDAAEYKHKQNMKRFEEKSDSTNKQMDALGKLELDILSSFEKFSDILEKIQNRPCFKGYHKDGVSLPDYDGEKLKEVSVGAGVLLGGLGGAAIGTAGGFAAAGATTTAVMALGTASTGTAISTLSGVAATNATLAALGGGAMSVGGGGVALGTTVLGAATLGVGLLVGGVIFNVTGSSLSDKADEAWGQMKEAEKKIDKICSYLNELSSVAGQYRNSIATVEKVYQKYFKELKRIVEIDKKYNWNLFSYTEKKITENTVLLVSLLYNMCKVQIVLKSEEEEGINEINHSAIEKSTDEAQKVFSNCDLAII